MSLTTQPVVIFVANQTEDLAYYSRRQLYRGIGAALAKANYRLVWDGGRKGASGALVDEFVKAAGENAATLAIILKGEELFGLVPRDYKIVETHAQRTAAMVETVAQGPEGSGILALHGNSGVGCQVAKFRELVESGELNVPIVLVPEKAEGEDVNKNDLLSMMLYWQNGKAMTEANTVEEVLEALTPKAVAE